jgi:hypothetical protein
MKNNTDILSKDFVDSYKNKTVPWGFNGMGYIVFKRTYSRLKENGQQEEWHETIERCINGAQKIGAGYTKEEAERLFDYVFNLKGNFAGRFLWQLGTQTVEKLGLPSLQNCFAYETEIITDQGIKQIGDLVNQNVNLMSINGKYINSVIKSYGEQDLYCITLKRKNIKKTIYCTDNHRWFIKLNKNNKEVTTLELKENDKLVSVYGQSIKVLKNDLCPYGIAAGLIFGDGSKNTPKTHTNIRLCGDKNKELIKYFHPFTIKRNVEKDIIIDELPISFKDKPNINYNSKKYLYSWLAGYFAADGHIKKDGVIRIHSSNIENLNFVRDICVKLGIAYCPIVFQERVGLGQKEKTKLYSITLNGSDLTEDFFLISEHKNRFINKKYEEHKNWTVVSIEKKNRKEKVFCAEVPDKHAFALEGNILTGNCWSTKLCSIEDFCFMFDMLMLGGGVGYSVRREDVYELPKVKHNITITHILSKDADFIVPDSRSGWIELLRKTLEAFFVTGKSFSYSTILVRGAGEPIKGFGGIASGPQPLINGIKDICKVFKTREGKKLRSIDVLDIANIIGSIVVSGNVRRSSQISLGDADDYLFLKAKRWDLLNIPNWRAMSNNTIVADSYEYTSDDLWEGFNGNGEPYGLFNLKLTQKYGRLIDGPMKDSDLYPQDIDNATMTNPCQPSWAKILTKNGIKQIKDVNVGEEIWSQDGWTKIINKWSTGIKNVYEYRTTAGCFYGTENHKLVSNGIKIEAKECESIDILCGPYYNENIKLNNNDIIDGIVIGDGSVHKASNNLVHLCIGENDKDYFNSEIKDLIHKYRPGVHDYAYEINTSITDNELPKTYERIIPDRFYYGDRHKICGFLRGLYSANGSICGKRITLKAASFKLIEQVQTMLSSIGIKSYYTTNKPSCIQFSNGNYICKESYDLNISTDRCLFYKSIGFIQEYKTSKLINLIKEDKQKIGKLNYDIIDDVAVM